MILSSIIYSYYPLFIFVLCSFLLVKAFKSGASRHYLRLFANIALLNLCQVGIYFTIDESFILACYISDIYLIAGYFLFTHFLQLSLSLSEKERKKWPVYLYIFPLLLTIMHGSGLMVESYRIEGGAILHNDGQFAWAFDAYFLIFALSTIGTLLLNCYEIKRDYHLQSKNLIAVLSFIPFVIAVIVIIILSNTANPVPVVLVVPSLSLYLIAVFYYISTSKVIDLTIGPKAFFKRLKVAYLLLSTLNTKKDLDEFNRQLQLIRYKEALQKNDNNYTLAAEELEMHPTTLRNAMNKYNNGHD